jgi:urea transporter
MTLLGLGSDATWFLALGLSLGVGFLIGLIVRSKIAGIVAVFVGLASFLLALPLGLSIGVALIWVGVGCFGFSCGCVTTEWLSERRSESRGNDLY